MSLAVKTTTGVLWNFSQQLATRGVGIVVTLLLARFLAPEDFGLIAMMSVFLALGSSLMESGLREALIRQNKVSQKDYATAFYSNLILGWFAYIALFISAPLIAEFYSEPRLIELIRVASLTIIVMSFQVIQVASLSRRLNFKAQFKSALPASLFSGLSAIVMAKMGYGIWALIAQLLLSSLIQTIILWRIEKWRPTLEFSWESLKGMYQFGYKLFISGVIDTIFQNLYISLIAKLFTASIAGLYFFSNSIKELLVQQLVRSIQAVTYPALASVQNDDFLLKQGYKKIVILMTFLLFPVILFLSALAEPIFQLFLPEKWHGASHYFQLLCLVALMMPLHSINLNILKVKGRSDYFLYLELGKKIVHGIVLLVTYRYGVFAIIIGQIVVSFLNYIPNSYFSKKLLGYGINEQIRDFFPILLSACISALVGFWFVNIINLNILLELFLSVILMGFSYIFILSLIDREAVLVVFRFIKKIIRRGS